MIGPIMLMICATCFLPCDHTTLGFTPTPPFWATVATDGSGKNAKYQQIPAAKPEVPRSPGAVHARDHGLPRRADRPPGRVRFPDELPRPVQEAGRHQSPRLPARIPGLRPGH